MGLEKIASVFSGHNFREGILSVATGNGYVLQMGNVERARPVDWQLTYKTNIESKRGEPSWLMDDDIIFLARGRENFALHLAQVPESTVCTSHFFVIRVHDKHYLPGFIAWQLNQPLLQQYFKNERSGGAAPHLKATTLKEAKILPADIKIQKEITRLDSLVMQEQMLYLALLENRQKQMRLLSQQILG